MKLPFAVCLVALLDQRHSILNQFLITFPKCLRLTPSQTSQAIKAFEQSRLSSVHDIFIEIVHPHLSRSSYVLTEEATETVNTLNEEFINGVNEAILQDTTPAKTKEIDVILHVTAALHNYL